MRRVPLLPALLFTIIMTQLPFVATLVISFMNWNAYRPDQRGFAGLSNYVKVFTDPDLLRSVWVTILMTVTVVLVSLVLGLGIALLLNRAFIGRGLVRTMMITPFLIVPVAAALVFKHAIYNPIFGLLNGVITWVWGIFGSDNAPQIDWITQFPLTSIEVTLIWQWTPFMTLILLAGLQSRPGEVLEAAVGRRRQPLADVHPHDAAAHAAVPGTRRPARLHLRHPDLRRRLHHHLRRARYREPAVHHLPDPVHRAGLRTRLRARGGRGGRIDR